MAKGTKELKQRITGVQNIQQITRAMEMVATQKLMRLQLRADAARPFSSKIQEMVERPSPTGSSPRVGTQNSTRILLEHKDLAVLQVDSFALKERRQDGRQERRHETSRSYDHHARPPRGRARAPSQLSTTAEPGELTLETEPEFT